jgi:hypothetical protein
MREPLRASDAGNDTKLDLGLAELGVVGGDDQVALHGQLATAAERKAGNGGNHWLPHTSNVIPRARVVAEKSVDEGLVRHFLDVGAGGKGFVRAGDHDTADPVVGIELLERSA